MTVQELIAQLQGLDPALPVWVMGENGVIAPAQTVTVAGPVTTPAVIARGAVAVVGAARAAWSLPDTSDDVGEEGDDA